MPIPKHILQHFNITAFGRPLSLHILIGLHASSHLKLKLTIHIMAARKPKTSSGRGRGRPSKSHHEELIKKLNKASGPGDGTSASPRRPRKSLKTAEALAANEEGRHEKSEDDDKNTDAAEEEDATGVGSATDTKTETKPPRGRPKKHPKKIDEKVAVEPEMEVGDADNDNDVGDDGDDGGDEKDADVDGDTIIVGGANQVETKRGRGRPKKDTTLTANTSSTPLSYRGSKTTVKTLVPAIVTQTGAVAKRRRGRPKKNPVAEVEEADEDVEPGDATNTFTPVNQKTSNPERSRSQRPRKQQKLMNAAELEIEFKAQDGPIHSSDEIRSFSQLFHHSPSSDDEILRDVPTSDAHTYAGDIQLPHDQADESRNEPVGEVRQVLVPYPGAKDGEGVYRTIDTNVVQKRRGEKNENEVEIDEPANGKGKGKGEDMESTEEADLRRVDETDQRTVQHPEPAQFRSDIFDVVNTNEHKAENAPIPPNHRELSLLFKAPQALMIADSTHGLDNPSMQLVSESSGDSQWELYSFLDPSLRPPSTQGSAVGMTSAALEEVDRGPLGVL